MNRFYVDSSALVSILFNEPHADFYRETLNKADEFMSSYLLEAEVYASAAREKIPLEEADGVIKFVVPIIPARSLRDEYREIFSHGYCRGGDAHHLATLLYVDPKRSELSLLTADRSQAAIAEKIGIRVLRDTE